MTISARNPYNPLEKKRKDHRWNLLNVCEKRKVKWRERERGRGEKRE